MDITGGFGHSVLLILISMRFVPPQHASSNPGELPSVVLSFFVCFIDRFGIDSNAITGMPPALEKRNIMLPGSNPYIAAIALSTADRLLL